MPIMAQSTRPAEPNTNAQRQQNTNASTAANASVNSNSNSNRDLRAIPGANNNCQPESQKAAHSKAESSDPPSDANKEHNKRDTMTNGIPSCNKQTIEGDNNAEQLSKHRNNFYAQLMGDDCTPANPTTGNRLAQTLDAGIVAIQDLKNTRNDHQSIPSTSPCNQQNFPTASSSADKGKTNFYASIMGHETNSNSRSERRNERDNVITIETNVNAQEGGWRQQYPTSNTSSSSLAETSAITDHQCPTNCDSSPVSLPLTPPGNHQPLLLLHRRVSPNATYPTAMGQRPASSVDSSQTVVSQRLAGAGHPVSLATPVGESLSDYFDARRAEEEEDSHYLARNLSVILEETEDSLSQDDALISERQPCLCTPPNNDKAQRTFTFTQSPKKHPGSANRDSCGSGRLSEGMVIEVDASAPDSPAKVITLTLPEGHDPKDVPSGLKVVPLFHLRRQMSWKQALQVAGLMLLGLLFVLVILAWVFSPVIMHLR